MPRGRKVIGPPVALVAPHHRDDPDALIDAGRQGRLREARVRALAEASRIARRARSAEPSRGSWIDAANHPRDPQSVGRSPDHYLPLLVRAVALLQEQYQWTQYRARRHVADRLLSLVPANLTARVFNLPPHVLDGRVGVARHAAARTVIMARLQQSC